MRKPRTPHVERRLEAGKQPRFSRAICIRLWQFRENGYESAEIAAKYQISVSYCNRLIKKGRIWGEMAKIPPMALIQGREPKKCAHGKPILMGDAVNCLDCDKSGFDHLDALNPYPKPADDKKVEPKPTPPLTRKQKRAKPKP